MDLALLWLWGGPTAAALIQFLACELPYAAGVVIKKKKRKERKDEEVREQVLGKGTQEWAPITFQCGLLPI